MGAMPGQVIIFGFMLDVITIACHNTNELISFNKICPVFLFANDPYPLPLMIASLQMDFFWINECSCTGPHERPGFAFALTVLLIFWLAKQTSKLRPGCLPLYFYHTGKQIHTKAFNSNAIQINNREKSSWIIILWWWWINIWFILIRWLV